MNTKFMVINLKKIRTKYTALTIKISLLLILMIAGFINKEILSIYFIGLASDKIAYKVLN